MELKTLRYKAVLYNGNLPGNLPEDGEYYQCVKAISASERTSMTIAALESRKVRLIEEAEAELLESFPSGRIVMREVSQWHEAQSAR